MSDYSRTKAVGIFLLLLVAVACALYSAQVASSKEHFGSLEDSCLALWLYWPHWVCLM